MTEADFEAQKANLRDELRQIDDQLRVLREQRRAVENQLITMMVAAQQEPWFGEAND